MRLNTKGLFFLFIICISLVWAQNPLKIYAIDVNTGSSTLIVSPTNKYVLIDAGMTNYGNHTVYPFLQNLGITHLDYTIVTHYHEDHIGGLDEVIYALSGFGSNDSILNWCYDRGDSSPPSNQIYSGYTTAAGSKRRVIGLGETLNLGGGAFMFCVVRNGSVVNGTGVSSSSGENYRSIGCVLQYGYFRLFISGDLTGITTSGEPDVETKVAPVVGDVDVYVVNHHGGRNSSNTVLLDSLRPEAAIFSQGTIPSNNNHPHQESIDRLVAHNTYLYQMNDNPSGGVIPTGHGRILNTTAVVTVNNAYYSINGDNYLLNGIHRDGACLEILQPRDTIAEAIIIAPIVRIKNLGNTTESFQIRCRIAPAYNRIQTISGLAPDETLTVQFDTMWYAMRGNYQVVCSTEVFGDSDPSNDKQTSSLTVAFYDSEIQSILNPTAGSTFFLTETITPKIIIKDNSEFSNAVPVKIFCKITNSSIIYFDSLQWISFPGITDTLTFNPLSLNGVNEGIYQCSVWVVRDNDLVLANNAQSVQFTILDPNGIFSEELSPYPGQNQQFKSVVMKLYNISGRLVKTQTYCRSGFLTAISCFIATGKSLLLSNISPGIYFLHITGIPLDNQSAEIKSIRKLVILPHN